METDNILGNKYFSIEFFNTYGLEKVAEVTEMLFEDMRYEHELGNIFVGQSENGKYYLFCESSEPSREITFNAFLRLL